LEHYSYANLEVLSYGLEERQNFQGLIFIATSYG